MSRYWSEVVHGLTPYVPGEQPKLANLVKLNTNELPYGPSPRVLQAIRAAAGDDLRLYPDPAAEGLRAAIGAQCGVPADHVFVGNGSDEVLAHAFMALLRHERPLWYPDISYSFYPVYCGLYGIQGRQVPLDERYRIDPDSYLPGPQGQAGAIFLPNPNAPTGHALARAQIERIVASNPQAVVVIDEAYVDFGAESAVPLVARHENLLVVQTLSKSRGLAGLRVGFAVGQPALLQALDRVKNSFNSYPLDRLALAGATAAMQDTAYFEATRQRVIASRQGLAAGLGERGFEVLPSQANFVFARHPDRDAAQIAAALRERGIIVRHFAKPRIDQFLRITVGTDEQCDALLAALDQILGR
ncbi:histidinol-phosphate transaminase [Orrella sp. JC864]|uniref:histidinol-phosphate transaminase n=1 Tax=Orrella sp. JC864 TaxID=3120298 RepID=UPI003008F8FE